MRDLNLIQFAISIILTCLILFCLQQDALNITEGILAFCFAMASFIYSGYRLITEDQ